MVTGCQCGGEIDGHTFDDAMVRHVNDCMVITMAQMMVPGFEVWHSGCVEGGGFSWICRCNGMVVGASIIHIIGYTVEHIKVALLPNSSGNYDCAIWAYDAA